MSDGQRKKRVYWVEGVTRSEVQRHLADRRPSRLRQQGPRRALVALMAVVLLGLALSAFLQPPKWASYAEAALLLASLLGFLALRASVRLINDAPDELLDERQIGLRNRAYLLAYRWLAVLGSLFVAVLMLRAESAAVQQWLLALLGEPAPGRSVNGLHLAGLMAMACLPAMVLAWQLPSEAPDDAG